MRISAGYFGAVAIAGALAACSISPQPQWVATQGPFNNWEIVLASDEIFGNSRIAALRMSYSANLVTGHLHTGFLDLMCFKSKPIVRVRFNYKVGSNQSANIAYRIDDNPGVEPKARFLRDFSTIVIDDASEVRRFLTEIAPASTLRMRVDSLIVGRTNIELNVQGAAAAMEATLSECPLPPLTPEVPQRARGKRA